MALEDAVQATLGDGEELQPLATAGAEGAHDRSPIGEPLEPLAREASKKMLAGLGRGRGRGTAPAGASSPAASPPAASSTAAHHHAVRGLSRLPIDLRAAAAAAAASLPSLFHPARHPTSSTSASTTSAAANLPRPCAPTQQPRPHSARRPCASPRT